MAIKSKKEVLKGFMKKLIKKGKGGKDSCSCEKEPSKKNEEEDDEEEKEDGEVGSPSKKFKNLSKKK